MSVERYPISPGFVDALLPRMERGYRGKCGGIKKMRFHRFTLLSDQVVPVTSRSFTCGIMKAAYYLPYNIMYVRYAPHIIPERFLNQASSLSFLHAPLPAIYEGEVLYIRNLLEVTQIEWREPIVRYVFGLFHHHSSRALNIFICAF